MDSQSWSDGQVSEDSIGVVVLLKREFASLQRHVFAGQPILALRELPKQSI